MSGSTGSAQAQKNRADQICQCWHAARVRRRGQQSEVAVDVHLP